MTEAIDVVLRAGGPPSRQPVAGDQELQVRAEQGVQGVHATRGGGCAGLGRGRDLQGESCLFLRCRFVPPLLIFHSFFLCALVRLPGSYSLALASAPGLFFFVFGLLCVLFLSFFRFLFFVHERSARLVVRT